MALKMAFDADSGVSGLNQQLDVKTQQSVSTGGEYKHFPNTRPQCHMLLVKEDSKK